MRPRRRRARFRAGRRVRSRPAREGASSGSSRVRKRQLNLDRPVRTGSLRRRVIVSVLALLLLVLLGMGVAVNLVLGDRLRSDLRQRLIDRAQFASALATQALTPQQLTDRLTGQGITATYRSGDQVVIGRDQQPPPGAGPKPPGGTGGPGLTRPSSSAVGVTVDQTGEQLRTEVSAGGGTVTLTANLADIDRTMATLTRVELAAGTATLVLAGLVLAIVVRLALSPLGRMTELARRIRDGARGRRLRPTRPNTDLGRTATAFDGMLDALELAEHEARAAEARMRAFLADASHDLRTPLAGVITTAERLLRDSLSRAERERRLVSLIREGQRAGRLVDDLLLITRLDNGAELTALRCDPVDVRAAVSLAEDRTTLLAPDRICFVEVDDGPAAVALCDRDALDRILGNLLDNARSATGPGDRIAVRVQATDETVTVEVSDTGPGVAPADAERIFDRFVRGDPARARGVDIDGVVVSYSGGTGLGLPIAQALARAHGGDLVCLAASGAPGATFVLTLPAAPNPALCRPNNRFEKAAVGAAQSD
jgi:two-component system, OmpR family, sensor kinase